MGITKRFVSVLLICAVLILIAGTAGGKDLAIVSFILCNVLALVLFVTDIIVTPKKKMLEAERILEEKLSLNGTHDAKITVRNRSDHPLFVSVHDELPEYFVHGEMPQGKWIAAHSEESFSYGFTPVKRGEYALPCITLRYRGVYGLCFRQCELKTEEKYRVYPNMKDLSRYGIQALSRSLFMSGLKPIRTSSDSGEFDSLRQYAVGDSFRHVNWAATARRSELTVNSFTPDRNQYIYMMLDSSRVMNARYENIMMLDWCINAAFLTCDYCLRGGDNVGMLTFSSNVDRYLPAGKGSAQFDAIASRMYDTESRESAADYDGAMAFFRGKVKRRSLVFVFTQIFNEEEALRFVSAVKNNLRGHLVYAITINDPRIPEMAAGKTEESRRDLYLRAAAIKTESERRRISEILDSSGIMHTDCEPDKLSLSAVAAYLNVKRQGIL